MTIAPQAVFIGIVISALEYAMNKFLTAAAASALLVSSAATAFAGNYVAPAADPTPYVAPAPASSIGSLGSGGGLVAAAAVIAAVVLLGDSDSDH